jgi:hypothetical protein
LEKEKMRRTQGTELASLTMLKKMNENLERTDTTDSFEGLVTLGSTNSLFPRKLSPPPGHMTKRASTSDLPEIHRKNAYSEAK